MGEGSPLFSRSNIGENGIPLFSYVEFRTLRRGSATGVSELQKAHNSILYSRRPPNKERKRNL